MHRFFIPAAALGALFLFVGRNAAVAQRAIDPEKIIQSWTAVNRPPTLVDSAGKRFVRFPEAAGAAMIFTRDVDFDNGDIDFDVRGRDVFQKSFVGVAFRVAADTVYDLVYLRPFNFASPDSVRHSHAVQYTSYPTFSWERLRADHPGKYEAAAVPQPRANDWVHVRLSIDGTDLRVYLDHASIPTLHVHTLGGRTHGAVGLWVGDLSTGDFANLELHSRRAKGRELHHRT
jgi:hypothetical protein